MNDGIQALCVLLGSFGGVSLIIWTSVQAKIARIKAEAEAHQVTAAPMPSDTVLAELKAMRQQMDQMQSTSHEFDISFDGALSRLEGRVGRLETKSAASVANAPADATLRNGQGQ
jgi:hypothetical protein